MAIRRPIMMRGQNTFIVGRHDIDDQTGHLANDQITSRTVCLCSIFGQASPENAHSPPRGLTQEMRMSIDLDHLVASRSDRDYCKETPQDIGHMQ